MRLVSTVIAVRDDRLPVKPWAMAECWRAARDSRVAIVAGGYGDGLPRLAEWHAGTRATAGVRHCVDGSPWT